MANIRHLGYGRGPRSPGGRFSQPLSVGSAAQEHVVGHADILVHAEDFAFRFKKSPIRLARGVDRRSRGELRLKVRAIVDLNVISGLPECEGHGLAALFGSRLPEVIGQMHWLGTESMSWALSRMQAWEET